MHTETITHVEPKPRLKSKTKYKKGMVLRVSAPVFVALQKKLRAKESIDALMRRLLNMENRKGEKPGLYEGYLVRSTGKVYQSLSIARGAAVLDAVKRGSAKAERPVRVREVV